MWPSQPDILHRKGLAGGRARPACVGSVPEPNPPTQSRDLQDTGDVRLDSSDPVPSSALQAQFPGAQLAFSSSFFLLLSPNREGSVEFCLAVFCEGPLSHHSACEDAYHCP